MNRFFVLSLGFIVSASLHGEAASLMMGSCFNSGETPNHIATVPLIVEGNQEPFVVVAAGDALSSLKAMPPKTLEFNHLDKKGKKIQSFSSSFFKGEHKYKEDPMLAGEIPAEVKVSLALACLGEKSIPLEFVEGYRGDLEHDSKVKAFICGCGSGKVNVTLSNAGPVVIDNQELSPIGLKAIEPYTFNERDSGAPIVLEEPIRVRNTYKTKYRIVGFVMGVPVNSSNHSLYGSAFSLPEIPKSGLPRNDWKR